MKIGYKVLTKKLQSSSANSYRHANITQYRANEIMVAPEGLPFFLFEEFQRAKEFMGNSHCVIYKVLYNPSSIKVAKITDLDYTSSISVPKIWSVDEWEKRVQINGRVPSLGTWEPPYGTVYASELYLLERVW